MEPLLFLVHRIPFPPNKGDKIRSYHLLRFLATRYDVHLGTFIDDEEDRTHLAALDSFCASKHVVTLDPRSARLRSVSGFLSGEALTLPYYRSKELRRWVERTVKVHSIRKAVIFSGAMAQYVQEMGLQVVLDFVDVDSAKWAQYAERHGWPSSCVYRREGKKLLSFERSAAASSVASVFVTRGEAELFIRFAPEFRRKVHVVENGVDSDYFSPKPELVSPYPRDHAAIVFTGVMDYWPNIDAVTWFAREILPAIVRRRSDARFYIVGMNPSSSVQTLTSQPNIVVTGRVPDVRPYLQHAAVVVAPLRVARGVQNKILEAMSMARPVVISSEAALGIGGDAGAEYEHARDGAEFAEKVLSILEGKGSEVMGRQARSRICCGYSWDHNMAAFGDLLDPLAARFESQGDDGL